MAVIGLTDTRSRAQFFQLKVLTNLRYWQARLEASTADETALDRERNGILRAISFALDLEAAAWSPVRELLVLFSPYMERRGHWDTWNRVLDRSIKVARQSNDLPGVADLSTLMARLLFRQGRFSESVTYYRTAIRTTRRLGDRFGEGRACTNLGYHYIEEGRWQQAEALCQYALKLFEQIDSNHGRAHTENHLGILYTRLGRWQQAQKHLKQACTIWQAMDDKHGLMYGFMNLGLLYMRMDLPDKALRFSEKALRQAELAGETFEVGTLYLNIGFAHLLQNNLAQAEANTHRAESILRPFSNSQRLANVQENLGLIYLKQQNWPAATFHLENALELWHTLDNKPGQIRTLLYFAEYELARENFPQAWALFDSAERLLKRYDQAGQHVQLHRQVKDFSRGLGAGLISG